ncbi:MAG: ribonuclease HI [Clostridia bacterium]|nr:ribonuclease HI [Clostridia bacterium]
MKKLVEIYTDGACSNNPGPGGWGAVLFYSKTKKEISGYSEQTTNNQMELSAAINALKALNQPCNVKLYSDSAYVVNAFKMGWIEQWRVNNFKGANNKEVLNIDLWKELIYLSNYHNIEWIKVKGHSDNEFNNRCDELARNEIEKNRPKNDDKQKKE